ncbi:hypothetical protein FA95DRAFT_1605107 [Auriscalpium vulgare]|uniref:Uncharacterized protein n=1 Tax=Auriscalpium vulgare TaxID=40419 RepID=A0ACB8RXG8_9AGAM|nr:hypothetical protein FA95DRAFT_1605107 [Auriscalpium vulgare]
MQSLSPREFFTEPCSPPSLSHGEFLTEPCSPLGDGDGDETLYAADSDWTVFQHLFLPTRLPGGVLIARTDEGQHLEHLSSQDPATPAVGQVHEHTSPRRGAASPVSPHTQPCMPMQVRPLTSPGAQHSKTSSRKARGSSPWSEAAPGITKRRRDGEEGGVYASKRRALGDGQKATTS